MADQKASTLPTFGPYGDKTLYGTAVKKGTAKADPEKNAGVTLKAEEWEYTFYAPANAVEAAQLLKAKPDMVIDLITSALSTKARASSWAEVRGGAVTVDVRMPDGTVIPRQNVVVVEALKKAGIKVEVLPRVKKTSTK